MSSWESRQDDEVEALSYIIEGLVSTSRTISKPLSLYFKASDPAFDSSSPHYCPLLVNLVIPFGYPTEPTAVPQVSFDYHLIPAPDCPDVYLPSRWLTNDFEDTAIAKLVSLYKDGACEVIYDWYDWLNNHAPFPVKTERMGTAVVSVDMQVEEDEDETAELNVEPPSAGEAVWIGSVVKHIRSLKGNPSLCASALPMRQQGFISIDPFSFNHSIFQGHIIKVHNMEDIKEALSSLYHVNSIARATHNMFVYCVNDVSSNALDNHAVWGYDDDGETAAAQRMAKVVEMFDVCNVLVVVTRWFGGVLLGPARFKYINNACSKVLEQAGYKRRKQ